jgi:hypothetical protein
MPKSCRYAAAVPDTADRLIQLANEHRLALYRAVGSVASARRANLV